MAQPRAILFDLDGTLVQTRESSWVLFEQVNRKYQLGIDTREAYFDLFRENMFVALPRIIGDEARSAAVLEDFLDLLRRDYQPLMVPGMADVVRRLAPDCVLGIVSSNATSAIARILYEAGLADCIAHVFGGDVMPDKRGAIRAVLGDASYATLRQCQPIYREEAPVGLKPDEVVLVTDTVGDIHQARECGVGTIAVSWGLHGREDLMAAGADFLASWPLEILAYLRPGAADVRASASDILEEGHGDVAMRR